MAEVENDELHNQFNDWIVNKELVVVNEMMAEGRLALMNKLKPYITQSHIRVNTKGLPRYMSPIPVNFFLTSNHPNSIIITQHDRRYLVFESPADRKPDTYYNGLWEWSGDKRSMLSATQLANLGAVAHYLINRPLSDFNGLGKAPETEGKRKLIEVSMPNLDKWARDSIEAADWPFSFDLINLKLIADDGGSLPAYVRSTISPHKLGEVLRASTNAEELGYMQLPNNVRLRVWAVRNIDRWKAANEKERGFYFQQWLDLVQGVRLPDVADDVVGSPGTEGD